MSVVEIRPDLYEAAQAIAADAHEPVSAAVDRLLEQAIAARGDVPRLGHDRDGWPVLVGGPVITDEDVYRLEEETW
jgi:plasmid stabilization system protein ParE